MSEKGHHDKETHGKRSDIDESTKLDEVKAPNLFERATEEFQALAHALRPKGKANSSGDEASALKMDKIDDSGYSGHEQLSTDPQLHHHKETHGRSNDIDSDMPIDEIKAPNIFDRAKEEIEAIVEAIHPKKGV